MSWKNNIAVINGTDIACQFDGRYVQIPFVKDLVAESISINGNDFEIINQLNVANRDEVILIQVKENDSNESTSRGNPNKISRRKLPGKTDA